MPTPNSVCMSTVLWSGMCARVSQGEVGTGQACGIRLALPYRERGWFPLARWHQGDMLLALWGREEDQKAGRCPFQCPCPDCHGWAWWRETGGEVWRNVRYCGVWGVVVQDSTYKYNYWNGHPIQSIIFLWYNTVVSPVVLPFQIALAVQMSHTYF